MNYYRFLDSRDIRNHLENMEYPLSTPEAAYLVWQCHNATLEEKLLPGRRLPRSCPIAPSPAGQDDGRCTQRPPISPGLHGLGEKTPGRLHPGRKLRLWADFSLLSNQEWREEGVWSERDTLFPNYTSCFAYCRQEFSEEIGKVRICKQVLGRDSSHRDSLTLTAELEPLCLDVSPTCDLDDVFPSLWVDLPTPFRRGDIVWDPSREPGFPHCDKSVPFVLDFCDNWNTSQMLENGVRPEVAQRGDKLVEKHRLHEDTSDMGAQGFASIGRKAFGGSSAALPSI